MDIAFMIIHLLITIGLIAGLMLKASQSEGLGALGGASDSLFKGSSAKGFEALVEKAVKYFAWIFLVSSFVSAVILPKIF